MLLIEALLVSEAKLIWGNIQEPEKQNRSSSKHHIFEGKKNYLQVASQSAACAPLFLTLYLDLAIQEREAWSVTWLKHC